jgi:hypothetical protein
MAILNLDPNSRLEPAPEPGALGYAVALTNAAIAAIPDWGGPASVIFGAITAPILGRRRDGWLEDLQVAFNDLSLKIDGLKPESLTKNEAFVSALVQATQGAMKTHQQEKLEALRNAILNVAAGTGPSDDLQTMFLNMVDIFTPKHLQVLMFFTHRDRAMYEVLRRERDITDPIVVELNSRRLIIDPRPYEQRGRDMSDALVTCTWTLSPLGQQFLKFIALPEAGR